MGAKQDLAPGRRRWTRLLALALLTVAGVGAGAHAPTPTTASSPALHIVFLPGICGWTGSDRYCHGTINAGARATGTFRTLIGQLSKAKIAYTPVFFSYKPGSAGYTVSDTHSSVARDVTGLEGQMRAAFKRDPKARFVLIGHSLGGVVAASWAVTNGRAYGLDPTKGLLRLTSSIVTLDSPLKGLYGRFWSSPVLRLFAGPVWYSLQTTSETIKEIVFFPDSWWRSTAHLHAVANSADEVVPPPESLLGEKKLVFDSRCPADILIFKTCHGAVLDDTTLQRYVVCHWISGPNACTAKPAATATRTPTVAPTATSTAAPSLTSTAPPPPPAPNIGAWDQASG